MRMRVSLGASTPMPFGPARSAGAAPWPIKVKVQYRHRCHQEKSHCSLWRRLPELQKFLRGKHCAGLVGARFELRCDQPVLFPSTIALGLRTAFCAGHLQT
jgi:hypothetical protein